MNSQHCYTNSQILLAVFTFLHCMWGLTASSQDLNLIVSGHLEGIPLRHFWQSTGFCPPLPHQSAANFDLTHDMVQNLAYIGAVPHGGIKQVRIHWLLDLVKVQSYSSGQPVYNFSALDQMIDLLDSNNLRPGFELMGSPSGIFTNMENKTQVYWWRDLVRQTASRYISQYGLDYVNQWNFETWNEPDCHDFDTVKMTVQGFLNYYDACSEGLKAASPVLVFGGPGDGCGDISTKGIKALNSTRRSQYAEALFAHVVNGTNYFTGQQGVRMDFISLHKKGKGSSSVVMDEELKSMSAISHLYPSLAQKPFYNDEADPLVGWSKDEGWRATAMYAAMAVKIIGQHQNILLGGGNTSINYTLLSNDNGFLSFYPHQFTQRTLLARFQMNKTKWASIKENYVTFVRKPIYAAMVLLSKLGDQQVFSQLVEKDSGQPLRNDSSAGVVASVHVPNASNLIGSDSTQWTAIVYSSSDTSVPTKEGMLTFDWSVPVKNASDLMLAIYVVSEKMANPYEWWHDVFGKPDFPTLQQFDVMRKNEGPYRTSLSPVSSSSTGFVKIPEMHIEEPDVLLFHLCQKSPHPPEQVTGLRLTNITTGQVLIVWSDSNIQTKCIKTFEVELQDKAQGSYRRINTEDTIVNMFVRATESESQVQGNYRVRAVDYWHRPGLYSANVRYQRR